MAVPRAKKDKGSSQVNDIRMKSFEEARWFLAKRVFPDYARLIFMAVMDEMHANNKLNLSKDDEAEILKSIHHRAHNYCTWARNKDVSKWDAKKMFVKNYGFSLDDLYI